MRQYLIAVFAGQRQGELRGQQAVTFANVMAAAQQEAAQNQQIAALQAQQAAAPAAAPAAGGLSEGSIQKLQQLAQLHSQGVLSDEEFSAAKAKILGI